LSRVGNRASNLTCKAKYTLHYIRKQGY
jgi:hypothetical protein